MSPLAQHIVRQMLEPPSKRTFNDRAGLFALVPEMHCFEVTEIIDIARDLGDDAIARRIDLPAASFLPAPVTWLENLADNGLRYGTAFIQRGERITSITATAKGSNFNGDFIGFGRAADVCAISIYNRPLTESEIASEKRAASLLYGTLAIINTPRTIGRKQHMPHRGLERRLLKDHAKVGPFPLKGWTELKLEAFYQRRDAEGRVREEHMTGQKCLHFCRAHLRIRLGKVEFVSSSWKGDAALGIKQTRYRLTPPRRREQ